MADTRTAAGTTTKALVMTAAALSLGAGMVHGGLTGEHFAEWWGYGVFFAVAMVAQGAYGLMLVGLLLWHEETGDARQLFGPLPTYIYLAGIAGNLSIIALWTITRTVGIPFFGPEAGEVEAVTVISVISKVLEGLVVGCLIAVLARARSSGYSSTQRATNRPTG